MRTHKDGEFPFANDFNAMVQALGADAAVEEGCAVDDGGTNDMTVSVASGRVMINRDTIDVGSQSVTLASADATYDRYDLIVADTTGSAIDVTGTASADPVAPDIPTDTVILAIIYVPAGASGVTNSEINDARVVFSVQHPVFVTQEAVSFGESAVTIDHTKTKVSGGAVRLGDRWYETNINANLSTTFSNGGEYGMQLQPDRDVDYIEARVSPETTPSGGNTIRLRDGGANGTILESATVSLSAGEWYRFSTALTGGQTYSVTLDGSYTMGRYDTPGSGEAGDITGGVSAGSNSSSYSFRFDAFRYLDGATNGSARVNFNSIPTDLQAWDMTTWQQEALGGSISFELQVDDGTGWSTYDTSPLPPYDISAIDPTTDVRIQAELSRTNRGDTSPAFTYWARRGQR